MKSFPVPYRPFSRAPRRRSQTSETPMVVRVAGGHQSPSSFGAVWSEQRSRQSRHPQTSHAVASKSPQIHLLWISGRRVLWTWQLALVRTGVILTLKFQAEDSTSPLPRCFIPHNSRQGFGTECETGKIRNGEVRDDTDYHLLRDPPDARAR